jgi:hypothetical protein
VKTTGADMNEARLRLTRIPKGADLILNKVSGAPGFRAAEQPTRDSGPYDAEQPRLSSKVTLTSSRSSRIGTSRIVPRTGAVRRMPVACGAGCKARTRTDEGVILR